jgi:hypothetical protein
MITNLKAHKKSADMKKLIMALALAGSSYCGSQAQTLQITIYDLTHFNGSMQEEEQQQQVSNNKISSCGVSSNRVCKMGYDGRQSCYKTAYSENFKVCKGNSGYFICCEAPGRANATHPGFTVVTKTTDQSYTAPSITQYQSEMDMNDNAVANNDNDAAPESQSYPSKTEMMRESAYLGNYPQSHSIRVCYVGDNVAENNQNPYHGCPSPQDDGPEKNNERNLNVSTPNVNAPIAPITGRN